jgi:hypothetical protein
MRAASFVISFFQNGSERIGKLKKRESGYEAMRTDHSP